MSSGSSGKRPPGRPPKATTLSSKQSSTIDKLFASANINESTKSPQKKKKKKSDNATRNDSMKPNHDELMEVENNEPDSNPPTIGRTEEDSPVKDDQGTPPRKNSTKKRARARGSRGSGTSIQTTLFGKDRRFRFDGETATRFDVSFRMEENNNPPEMAQTKFQGILSVIQDHSDLNACILPWKEADSSTQPIIDKPDQVPKQLSQLRLYFPRLRLTKKSTTLYTNIFLGHDLDATDLLLDISFWLEEEGIKMYRKTVQAEEVAVIGWFLYGIKEINAENLTNAIFRTDHKTKVGLRQMKIRTTVSGKASPIRALGIECDASEEIDVKNQLIKLYKSSRTSWPLGIKLRYMRDARFLCGSEAVAKTTHLLGKHDRFQHGICTRRTNDIVELDFVNSSHHKSLRTILMSLKSTKKPSNGLFHSVDPAWNNPDTHIITFLPDFAEQAENIISQMVPYLIHIEGEYVRSFFSSEALARAEGCTWDVEKDCAVSALDNELNDIEEFDDSYDIGNPSKPSDVLDISTATTSHVNSDALFAYDNASVSTLGTTGSVKFNPSQPSTMQVGNQSNSSSVASDLSHRTKSSIITAIKQDLRTEIQSSLASLLKAELTTILGPIRQDFGSNLTNPSDGVTNTGDKGETNATQDIGKHKAGPSDGAGKA